MEEITVPKNVEQIIDYLFIDTYKSNNMKIGVNDMTANDSEMCMRISFHHYSGNFAASMRPTTLFFEILLLENDSIK